MSKPFLLEVANLSVRRGGRRVLDRVTLTVNRGETWALLGPNGAGKSTLLEALVGTVPLCGGEMRLAGRAVASLRPRDRARTCALVGREVSHDLPLRAREVVALGRLPHAATADGAPRSNVDIVDDALAATGCLAFAATFMSSLSDGERQRVHLARALAQKPKLVMMDEATAHLDLAHRHEALRLVQEFAERGGAALVAVHDLELALRYASHVAVLANGTLVERGRPQSVLTRALLRDVFSVNGTVVSDSTGVWLHVLGPVTPGAAAG